MIRLEKFSGTIDPKKLFCISLWYFGIVIRTTGIWIQLGKYRTKNGRRFPELIVYWGN